VARGDDDPADEDRAALADHPVGDPSPGERHQVDGRRVDAYDGCRPGHLEAETPVGYRGRHEEDEDRAQPVVREALPHLREEEGGEASGMAEEATIRGAEGGAGR